MVHEISSPKKLPELGVSADCSRLGVANNPDRIGHSWGNFSRGSG